MSDLFSSLTAFRLREEVEGRRVNSFEDFIDPKKETAAYRLRRRYSFDAKLYIATPEVRAPAWVEPLEAGFGELGGIPESISNSAVMIVRVASRNRHQHFAFTFGFGRYLLRPNSYVRNYGLRVALNAIYPRGGNRADFNRLRSVDSRTVAANTVRTRRQVDRPADFEGFYVDIERDFLSGLTGTPVDQERWGSRIDGADSLHLTKNVRLEDLGELCLSIDRHSKSVPRQFSWVDKMFAVRDSALTDRLKNLILDMVKSETVARLELAPPDLLEWSEIANFAFSFASERLFPDPGSEEYIAALREKGKLADLSLAQLTSGHRLLAFDNQGTEIARWTVFRSLSCEIALEGKTYVLSEGEFFEVAADYLDELNRMIGRIAQFRDDLPEYNPNQEEDYDEEKYNQEAAASSAHYLLLDRKTVRLRSRTTPVEICDILTSQRELIHVKRKLNSSSLSHLFAQGLVSAELLLTSDDFRQAARARIVGVETSAAARGRFSRLFPAGKGITPAAFTVVYAIAARWNNRRLAEALPFFSRVNLRRYAGDLRRMGYNVAWKGIQDRT